MFQLVVSCYISFLFHKKVLLVSSEAITFKGCYFLRVSLPMIVISYCFSWKVATFRGYSLLCWNLKITVLESLQVVNKTEISAFYQNVEVLYTIYVICKLLNYTIHCCHSSLIMNHDYFSRCSISIPTEENQRTK